MGQVLDIRDFPRSPLLQYVYVYVYIYRRATASTLARAGTSSITARIALRNCATKKYVEAYLHADPPTIRMVMTMFQVSIKNTDDRYVMDAALYGTNAHEAKAGKAETDKGIDRVYVHASTLCR